MLERAAGCVETAGRRFLHDTNGAIRSRRVLPRHFWKHQGASGDVAHWLRAVVYPPGQRPPFAHNPPQGANPVDDGNPLFLDFLYPQGTRDPANLRLSRHPKRLVSRRKRRSPVCSRTYSSHASHLGAAALPETESHLSKVCVSIDARQQAIDDLDELMRRQGVDYDKAWVLYVAAGDLTASKPSIQSALCAYLGTSRKFVDQDRAWEVFEAISPENRSEEDYLIITRAGIQSSHTSKLKSICEQAIAKGYGDTCCALSFSYHAQRYQWHDALEIWDMRSKSPEESDRPHRNTFFTEMNASMIPECTLSFGTFLASEPDRLGGPELGNSLLHQMSTSLHTLESTSIGVLSQILGKYHEMGILRQKHYYDLIKTLQASSQRQTFVWSLVVYRYLRSQDPYARPPQKILARQVERLLAFDMTSNVQFFVDELVHFWEKPPLEVYKQIMIAFSHKGDVAQVNSAFNKLLADHGKPKSRWLVTPLLYVHARNGHVQATLDQFKRVSEEFHLQPNAACWNILLVAYGVSGDPEGALSTFKQMREAGVPPDSYTFSQLMGLCAMRGDIDSVRQLLKEAQTSKVHITMQVLEKIVQVYGKIGQLHLAEDFAMACLESNAKGSPMKMLNGLLMQYVMRVDTQSFERVLRQMKAYGILPDATTHAANMLRLALVGKPDEARLTLRRLHKKRILHATEYHYSIVLWGYVRSRNFEMVDVISREISERFGNSGTTSSLLELKDEVQRHLETLEHGSTMDGTDLQLIDVEKRLLDSITTSGAVKVPSDSTTPTLGQHNTSSQSLLPHYVYLIKEYGARGAVEQARALFQEFVDKNSASSSQAHEDGSLPIRLTTEMMNVYLKAGQFAQVEECWRGVVPSAVKVASPINVGDLFESQPSPSSPSDKPELSSPERLTDSSEDSADKSTDPPHRQKPQILPSQQFILSRPFSIYLRALAYQGEMERLLQAVTDFKDSGFALSTFNMSTIVQMLASSDKYEHLVEAFRIYEVEFMPNWPGWSRLERGSGLRPTGAPKGIAALDDPRTRRSSQQFLGRHARKHWSNIAPGFMQPTYVSMVYLAAALNRVRATSIVNGTEELANLFEIAPTTIEQVGKLRYLREKYQGVLIRFRSHQPEMEWRGRPPNHAVTPGGILGTGRRAQRRKVTRDWDLYEQDADLGPIDEEFEWNAQLQRHEIDLGVFQSSLSAEDRMDLEHDLTRYHRQRHEKQNQKERPERRARRKSLRALEEASKNGEWSALDEAEVPGHSDVEHEFDTPEPKTH
ncbi:hypothetical protein N7492_000919 [Penicillium capsulatum]|uniref:Pentacotripeptide-repeat region of PRORP domain-containing protein n=1 Tax=Penicillium capsulatum TaxID=69766 RepID=A0A9W9IS79_9EURO|nr:hypothetical protein N7492_000919 [Penicillium capsulatum]KAJ6130023.1 hypothetical protein N7512_002803 [Penicillium capsulatum]